MAQSRARTVDAYLAQLPPDRRAVRDLVTRQLPDGYVEVMRGMIYYEVPIERTGPTYNGQPICYLALAAQKNYCALYVTGAYQEPKQRAWLENQFSAAGKKLDMGKSCLRFRHLDDLPLSTIGTLVASTPPAALIKSYEKSHPAPAARAAKSSARKLPPRPRRV